ncbi:MAG: hypothetical protein JW934_23685 [Anaerolineae bacterium]|nr:hypothetical protein [Anaerolineae bacterium]
MADVNPGRIASAVLMLDAWLDTARGLGGYGGPVTHWWQHCLLFTGAGLDWRYEGIIAGYLNLFEATGDTRWLDKARRAGDDLVNGQLTTGTYRNSSFERNPYTGGTPHEAGCDVALLLLAQTLQDRGDDGWQSYAATAERNLEAFILGVLWNLQEQRFDNTADDASFVPNKAATTVEALIVWDEWAHKPDIVQTCVVLTLDAIAASQVHKDGSFFDGAIPQRATAIPGGTHYFPFYIARCIPALVQGCKLLGESRYLDAAKRALSFILRQQLPDGSFPQVIYANGRVNRQPRWIAGAAEILRAAEAVGEASGQDEDLCLSRALDWLLHGQLPSGGFRTAAGFAAQVSQRTPPSTPDFADLLPVCGWNSMVLRYLSKHVDVATLNAAHSEIPPAVKEPCFFNGRKAYYCEDIHTIKVHWDQNTLYCWEKGKPWASLH